MRKIKVFGYIVLVIAFVMVFSGVASAYTPTEEDLEYMGWYAGILSEQEDDSRLFQEGMGKGPKRPSEAEWEYTKMVATLMYTHAEAALDEIDQFEVSAEYAPIKIEDKLSLIDKKWAAYYLKKTAEDYLSGDLEGAIDNMEKSIEYRESSLAHSEKALALSEALPSPTPTPESPSFEAIFAIVSLLAIAFGLRRKR